MVLCAHACCGTCGSTYTYIYICIYTHVYMHTHTHTSIDCGVCCEEACKMQSGFDRFIRALLPGVVFPDLHPKSHRGRASDLGYIPLSRTFGRSWFGEDVREASSLLCAVYPRTRRFRAEGIEALAFGMAVTPSSCDRRAFAAPPTWPYCSFMPLPFSRWPPCSQKNVSRRGQRQIHTWSSHATQVHQYTNGVNYNHMGGSLNRGPQDRLQYTTTLII